MATYRYRCDRHGELEVSLPIGTAPESIECEACGRPASRVFSAPMLSFKSPESRAIHNAIDHAEKSRESPEVVTSLPARGRRKRTPMAPPNPALRKLPRP